MKLDKWPEEVEVGGWRWKLNDQVICGTYYVRHEKLHVPPTMREIMEHLLRGGWARYADCNNADFYYRLTPLTEEIEHCFKRHDSEPEEWSFHWRGIPRFESQKRLWFLIQPGEWFEGEGK
jgi:hypothetical protein